MFDDNFGLTDAVLELRKNMTRRFAEKVLVEDDNGELHWNGEFKKPRYKVGEVVAVAQAYRDIPEYNPEDYEDVMLSYGAICEASHPYSQLMKSAGWGNKMFVRADLMPTRILITAWRRERMQEISDEDCLREGIIEYAPCSECGSDLYLFDGATDAYYSPREAFADLIRKMSGKRAWDDNPYVDVYEFELVK